MIVTSPASTRQATLELKDRWAYGPLELVFLDRVPLAPMEFGQNAVLTEWNMDQEGGFFRSEHVIEWAQKAMPRLIQTDNPNLFLVGIDQETTQPDVMLGSVVPLKILREFGIAKKERANLWLIPFGHRELPGGFGRSCRRAFEKYIWTKLNNSSRYQLDFFSKDSSLRLIAGDMRYWMSRLFRTALEHYHNNFEPVEFEDERWESLEKLQREFAARHPDQVDKYVLRRPRMGGHLWDVEDEEECEAVVDDMINGLGVMPSIDPVIEILKSHRVHEDLSARNSRIKEDFERSFYSKRSKVKVSVVETCDEFPAWDSSCPSLDEDVMFRDLLSCFDLRDRRLLIAVRNGKTQSAIASEEGLQGHASISRRLAKIKARVRRLLS